MVDTIDISEYLFRLGDDYDVLNVEVTPSKEINSTTNKPQVIDISIQLVVK